MLTLTLTLTLALALTLTLTLNLTRCQRQCGRDRTAAGCPQEDCVCDWSGDWPDDDKDGFAAWSLESLGIQEEHKEVHKS